MSHRECAEVFGFISSCAPISEVVKNGVAVRRGGGASERQGCLPRGDCLTWSKTLHCFL